MAFAKNLSFKTTGLVNPEHLSIQETSELLPISECQRFN